MTYAVDAPLNPNKQINKNNSHFYSFRMSSIDVILESRNVFSKIKDVKRHQRGVKMCSKFQNELFLIDQISPFSIWSFSRFYFF